MYEIDDSSDTMMVVTGPGFGKGSGRIVYAYRYDGMPQWVVASHWRDSVITFGGHNEKRHARTAMLALAELIGATVESAA